MSRWLVVILLSITVGCAGVSNVSYPLSDGTYHNQRTLTDPHAFSPTVQRSWMEICQAKADAAEPDYTQCSSQGTVQFATTGGYLEGLGAAALYSGAIVGGAALIGNGLAQSGTTVNQAGGGAQQSQNTSASSYQSQGQSQAQSRSNGHGQR